MKELSKTQLVNLLSAGGSAGSTKFTHCFLLLACFVIVFCLFVSVLFLYLPSTEEAILYPNMFRVLVVNFLKMLFQHLLNWPCVFLLYKISWNVFLHFLLLKTV